MSSLKTILGELACAGLGRLGRGRLAQTSGNLRLPGLRVPVEVIRDHWGVPHIYAQNSHDLMFAQGFVHAQDRLWQMDFQRRLASGRLAEILGQAALPVDRWLRTIGLRRMAERDATLLNGDIGDDIRDYAAGINAFIAQGKLPLEFTLLRYHPEPWVPADTLAWVKLVAWNLSVNWESEILRAQLIARLGPELAAELEPDNASEWSCIVPSGLEHTAMGALAQERAEQARAMAGPPAQHGLGSNNWVVSGARTVSGAPLVANDLHQLMGLPCIWYENHLEGGDLHVSGCSFPGAPAIISGHNDYVAWGLSNGFPDVQDLYIEHLRRTGDGRVQYEFAGEWHDAQVIRERIRVRGKGTVCEEVIVTRHGPIINGLAPESTGEEPLALRWSAAEPETIAHAYHYMNRARNCREFREALRYWTSPSQNIVYADTRGNIGYTFPGRIPVRAKGNGTVPVPGWTGEYEWTGYVPFEELPHLENPARGYVATANNRVVDGDYPYHISCDYCSSDRACRIRELIEARERIDVAYACEMQLDQVSPGARRLAAYMGSLQVDDPELAQVVHLMREWDGHLSAGSAAAAVHEVFAPRLMSLVLSGKLGDLTARYMGRGINPLLADGSLLGFRAWEWLQSIVREPRSHWFDLGHGETRDDVMRQALREAVDWLKRELGPEIGDWAWGKLHKTTYAHTLGRVWPLGSFFNRGPYPLGGDYTTVCATGATQHPEHNGDASIGPSYRFVADVADWRRAVAQLAPGQSGQPGSPHYDDQIEHWLSGRPHPMLFAREDVDREAEARLHLLPA